MRAMVKHPAGYDLTLPLPLFERIHGEVAVAFRENRTFGIRNAWFSRPHPHGSHARAARIRLLRAYASPASSPRPSQGSLLARAGSPLAGRVSHPLDDKSKFHGVIAIPPIPIDQQRLVALFDLRTDGPTTGRRICPSVGI